jgi:hypothetical protein
MSKVDAVVPSKRWLLTLAFVVVAVAVCVKLADSGRHVPHRRCRHCDSDSGAARRDADDQDSPADGLLGRHFHALTLTTRPPGSRQGLEPPTDTRL